MYFHRIFNKQVAGDDRALWMHTRAHAIGISSYYRYDNSTPCKTTPNDSNDLTSSSLVVLSNGSLKPFALMVKGSRSLHDHNDKEQPVEKPLLEQAMNKQDDMNNNDQVVRGTFECRACNKVFYSHQALGGHRASHKKIKGCFAASFVDPEEKKTNDGDQIAPEAKGDKTLVPSKPTRENSLTIMRHSSFFTHDPKRKSKSHECSICHRVFPSGQALGGHKRCHWLPSSSPNDTTAFYTISTFHNFLDEGQPHNKKPKFSMSSYPRPLDLNKLPPSLDNHAKTYDNIDKIDVGSRLTFLGQRGLSKDINSIYQNMHKYKVAGGHTLKTSKVCSESNGSKMIKTLQLRGLKNIDLDGNENSSSWLHLGIGSNSNSNSRAEETY